MYYALYSCHNTTHTSILISKLVLVWARILRGTIPHIQCKIPPSCVQHLQNISVLPVLFFCCVLFTVLHGKGFVSSSSKHLSRCALITEDEVRACLQYCAEPYRPTFISAGGTCVSKISCSAVHQHISLWPEALQAFSADLRSMLVITHRPRIYRGWRRMRVNNIFVFYRPPTHFTAACMQLRRCRLFNILLPAWLEVHACLQHSAEP